jgi:tRNA(His) guanylyltransferase
MKWYESRYTNDQFMPMAPVIARLDGKAFHTFTKGLKRPYDEQLSNLMIMTTQYLVQETNARCGYTQSDEITLVWLAEDWESEIFFAGKLQKMNSVLASMCTAFFNRHMAAFLPEKAKEMPLFDSRVFQVPTEFEAANCFIWREQDATRNSVQMAARAHFSHNECHEKDGSELQEMLWKDKGVNWSDYPNFFKRGTYIRRRAIERKMTFEELSLLPEKHHARQNPDLIVKRSLVVREDFPPLIKIINREAVILHGADPVQRSDEDVAK